MANQKKGEYSIRLDKLRTIKLNFNALCDAEGVLGKTIIQDKLGLSEVRAILWAGLQHEDKAITIDEVGELITSKNMLEVMKITGEAMSDFFAAGEATGTGATPTG